MSLSQNAVPDPAPSVRERLDVTLAEALDKLQELVAYLPLLVVAVFAVLANFAGR